jgi:predicted hotdog family 3-hydroxylacyl-ACP dehydratase
MTLPPIRDVVPHSGRMLLLDRLVAFDDDSLTAELTIREGALFAQARGVGAWVGIEYMAQAVAAFAGTAAFARGEKAKVGFLVGTRHYACNVSYFPPGATLRVLVRRDAQEAHGVGSFVCSITGEGIVAEATITVIQPDDPARLTGGVKP